MNRITARWEARKARRRAIEDSLAWMDQTVPANWDEPVSPEVAEQIIDLLLTEARADMARRRASRCHATEATAPKMPVQRTESMIPFHD
jgi:transposase